MEIGMHKLPAYLITLMLIVVTIATGYHLHLATLAARISNDAHTKSVIDNVGGLVMIGLGLSVLSSFVVVGVTIDTGGNYIREMSTLSQIIWLVDLCDAIWGINYVFIADLDYHWMWLTYDTLLIEVSSVICVAVAMHIPAILMGPESERNPQPKKVDKSQ